MDVTTSKVSALILFGIIKFCFGIAPLAIRGQLKRGNGGGRWIKRFIGKSNLYYVLRVSPKSKAMFPTSKGNYYYYKLILPPFSVAKVTK